MITSANQSKTTSRVYTHTVVCGTRSHRIRKKSGRARASRRELANDRHGVARIRDPHSATVRAIKPVYVKNFNSSARVTTGRAFLARRCLPRPRGKSAAPPGANRKCTAVGTRAKRTHRLN